VKSYLYYIQDEDGREVVSATVEVERVSEVSAVRAGEHVALHQAGAGSVAVGEYAGEQQLTLYRVPSDDKLARPVAHPLRGEYYEEETTGDAV
jgi:hypothetical protein